MYKFKKAEEQYGLTTYSMGYFEEPEFEILTPEVEEKIIEFMTNKYVIPFGKKIRIQEIEATPEFHKPATRSFIVAGAIITYAEVKE